MLFPTDPDKRPELWASFAERLASSSLCFVVHGGQRVADEMRLTPLAEDANQLINAFRSADVIRFGSSRGQAVGPFFAFDLDKGIARLTEYAVALEQKNISSDLLQEALQSVAISLFFERKDIEEILIPFSLLRWDAPEWGLESRTDGAALRRVVS